MYRKVVTVLFCDVVGSTALGESIDPEALQGILVRYFERMRGIVESHEGSVEKFIGDAVVAVFGVPLAHEDDALRACRAAVEMQAAFPELGVEGRIGINTGEVVTGTAERVIAGDAVNIAARLQQASEPGEVLIGAPTLELVIGAVVSEPIAPLDLKGKRAPVAAHRLVGVLEAAERSHESRFVGRDREVGLIHDAWQHAVAEGRCELTTIVGEAGLGKSRLVAEALTGLDARIVRGRCLSYGEGITYWPVVEVIKQLDGMPSDPTAAAALRSLIGDTDAGTSAEEIAWAFRKLLEEHAPLVVVLDDIQWGEQAFLDLVEGVALLSSSAILLLCMSRPELLTHRADWPVGLRLEPLPASAAEELIAELPADLRDRIARAAGGNPLFLTEMVAMAGEAENVDVPPTLRALLAARLDQLEPTERVVLERGAVEGELFHRGAVQALSPEETPITPTLAVLTRKNLIRPDRAQLPGDDAFRFRHLLVRDAAYEALPKSTRAELHRRLAEWFTEGGGDVVEQDEILGYHLERAHEYATELRLAGSAELARRAAAHLRTAGERSAARGDAAAAIKLLRRAANLSTDDRARREIQVELASALVDRGELTEAESLLTAVVDLAQARGEEIVEWRARLGLVAVRMWLNVVEIADARKLAREAVAVFERHADEAGQARAWLLVGMCDFWLGGSRAADEAFARGLTYARSVAGGRDEAQILSWYLIVGWFGPTPAREAVLRCRTVLEETSSRQVEAFARTELGALLALSGRFDEARESWEEGVAILEELGLRVAVAGSSQERADIEFLAGDLPAAEAVLREACAALEELGERGFLSTRAACLGLCLALQDRPDEAEPFLELAERSRTGGEADVVSLIHAARAAALLSRGALREAEDHARQSLAAIADWDHPSIKGDALARLADILKAAGREDEAVVAYSEALVLYEQKENLVAADRVLRSLALLKEETAR